MFRRFPKWTFIKDKEPISDGRYLVFAVDKSGWQEIRMATYYAVNNSWYIDDFNGEVVAWIESPLTPYGMRLTK